MTPIRSKPYSVTASAYLGRIAVALFWRLWWLLLIPAALIAVGIATDWRVALIGLMCLFIIYPGLSTLALIRYGLSPDVAMRSRASAMQLDDSVLTLLCDPDHAPIVIPACSITAAHITSHSRLQLDIGPRPHDIILIPADALDPADLSLILGRFAPEWD